MIRPTQRNILLVDNQKYMRETMAALLNMEGYHVSTAIHGFDALRRLDYATPDLIISGLTSPHAASVEFLSIVRRQFPSIPVIAVCTANDSDPFFPASTMVDVSYAREQCSVDELLHTVAQMIHTRVIRPAKHEALSVRIRLTTEDSSGTLFFLLTCTTCRLSFSLSITQIGLNGVEQTPCPFCTFCVGRVSDVSLSFAS